jgi:hypothetical protein
MNAVNSIQHLDTCPEHTAMAQMMNRDNGQWYRAKCMNCGQLSPEYTREEWDEAWPKGIGPNWPKRDMATLVFDGNDFIEIPKQ